MSTRHFLAALMTVTLAGGTIGPPSALAISPPAVDTTLVPADSPPGPEEPMRQASRCGQPVAAAAPDVGVPAPGFTMLNITDAWRYSTGNGISVAVIDTGVQTSPRLPVRPGGDYVTGGDGLTDCDGHGTIVASVIAAAPQGSPMPPPMPPAPGAAPADGSPAGAAPAGAPDGVVGVAPHVSLISIRQSSRAFQPASPGPAGDAENRRTAGTLSTLARAIVHAADMGAEVINIGVAACVPASEPLDQGPIGAAVWYAATVKDSLLVAAGGNAGEDGCAQNPAAGRDWNQVKTISSPSWFTDYVLSVGAVDQTGAPLTRSLAGPWIGVAAPGFGITGLSPQTAQAVNAYPPPRAGESDIPFWGTSFAAAYVSGVAALVRAKYPRLSAHQVIHRIKQTAHNPPGGVDSRVGYGLVDPVAALTFNVPPGDRVAPGQHTAVIRPPAAPPPTDRRARSAAVALCGVVLVGAVLAAAVARARRSR